MRLPPSPGGGGPGWLQFAQGIIGLFGQRMPRPFWLWNAETTDLPTDPAQGANTGALAYDTTNDSPAWYTSGDVWVNGLSQESAALLYLQLGGGTLTGLLNTQNVQPSADNTYYLGRNDDDSPKAYKGVILKDQGGTGKYYRLEVFGDALRIVDLTD